MKEFCLTVFMLLILLTAQAADATSIKMGPASLEDSTTLYEPYLFDSHTVSDPFDVKIFIEEANNLSGFNFTLEYDPTVLEATGFTLGDFLTSTGRTPKVGAEYPIINDPPGTLGYGVTTIGDDAEPDGNGVLGIIRFHLKDRNGVSDMSFSQLQVSNNNGTYLDLNDFEGLFESQVTQTHTITTRLNEGGAIRYDEINRTINSQEVRTVVAGTSKSYSVLPDSGYVTKQVQVNGQSMDVQSGYEFTDIQEDIEFVVVFREADGDINGDEAIDLKDLIMGLQILAGVSFEPASIYPEAELDTDGDDHVIGMQEVLYIFKNVSERS